MNDIKNALRSIGLALSSCSNTVTTDDINAKPDDKSWRINNSKEIALVRELEQLISTGTCPLCWCCNKNQ